MLELDLFMHISTLFVRVICPYQADKFVHDHPVLDPEYGGHRVDPVFQRKVSQIVDVHDSEVHRALRGSDGGV